MRNDSHFIELVPAALHSVPYISSSHVCKAYLALENLYAHKPNWPDAIWDYCASIIRNDEPKVDGLIINELLDLETIEDPTSGRDFGPNYILRRGLMPLSYWAMRKKCMESGFKTVFDGYLDQAVDHPRFLGHEISVLASYWNFYSLVLNDQSPTEHLDLFLQRFTEFAVFTFHSGKETVFEHPEIDEVPPEDAILKEALINPGFFGHNILAFVWTQRIKPMMTDEQYQSALYSLTVMNRWHEFGEPPILLAPHTETWDDATLDEHFKRYFLDGPTNIHQITLADALMWVWNHAPEYRNHCAANVLCFTEGTSPKS